MAIIRDNLSKEITFECDGCGDTQYTFTDDFHDALASIKNAGWLIRKVMGSSDDWVHCCSRECLRQM